MNHLPVPPPRFRRKTFFFLSILFSISINLLALFLLDIYHLNESPYQKYKSENLKKTLIVRFNDLSRFINKKTKSFFREGLYKKQKWKGRKIALSDLAVNVSAINFKPDPALKEGALKNIIGRFGDNTGYVEFSVDGHNSVFHYSNTTRK